MDILDRISALLQGRDQKDLTNYLGLKSVAFSEWKSGKSKSYRKYLIEIADFFNVSIDYLVYGKEERTPTTNLTEIEDKLLLDFRSLSQQGQDYIRQQMFMAREVYKKQDTSQADLKVG